MFDMKSIGRRITALRGERNMTQMELADKLGISYQAVSNWERGQTMPDISKLSDLSEIFGISIDELLGNTAAAKVVKAADGESSEPVTLDEAAEAAPILKPSQVDKFVDDDKEKAESAEEKKPSGFNLRKILKLAPFMSRQKLDSIVLEAFKSGCSIKEIHSIAPFVSGDTLDQIVTEAVSDGGKLSDIIALAPFMKRSTTDKLAELCEEKPDFGSISALAPFLSRDTVDKLADRALNRQE